MISWENNGRVEMGRSVNYMMLVITGINRGRNESDSQEGGARVAGPWRDSKLNRCKLNLFIHQILILFNPIFTRVCMRFFRSPIHNHHKSSACH